MTKNNIKPIRVGIVGTGAIGRGLALLLQKLPEFQLSGILTRRKGVIDVLKVDANLVTNDPAKLFENSDILVVTTGDVIYSTNIINKAFAYDLPVVTMDADTLVVSGSWLSQRGKMTEAEGDQPGCLAILKEEITQMGFTPLVYGNIKGYLNKNPSREDMIYWANKQGFSINSVTSFTDGTKLQIEQVLIANGLTAKIAKQGLIGVNTTMLNEGANILANEAFRLNMVLSDYVISPQAPPGVFIVSTHHQELAKELETYKMGTGPYYLHYKPIHLCFFEIPKTIKNFYNTGNVLLTNGNNPTVGVAAVAKKEIPAGYFIDKGIGSFELRGEAINIAEQPNMVPIGLITHIHIKRTIEPGQIITFDDVDLPDSLALTAWIESTTMAR
jgi:predicted homoserine dehydrogenase-like protein